MDKFYSVNALAETCNVTPRAVRLYTEKKLLNPVRVGHSYVFTTDSVTRLKIIRRDKRIGFTLEEIKSRLSATSATEIKNLIARIDTVIKAARKERKCLSKQLAKSARNRS